MSSFRTPIMLSAFFCAGEAFSATIRVPDDYATIQAGVAAAAAGDTVAIACGTYYEHDIGLATSVVLRSQTGMPDCVTIDADRQGRVLVASGVQDLTLQGVTVKNGLAPGWEGGGGLVLSGVHAIVRNCRFVTNEAWGGGGGIAGGALVVSDTDFIGNICGGGPAEGAGSAVAASGQFDGCRFAQNNRDAVSCDVATSFSDCTFVLNDNGIWIGTGYGTSPITRCTFAENGGVALNVASYGKGTHSRADLSQCTLVGNRFATATQGYGFVGFDQCVVAFNTGTVGGISSQSCTNIFGNTAGDWVGILSGRLGVDGNFSADPLFCDVLAQDFSLHSDSPCLPGNHPLGALCGQVGAWPEACGLSVPGGHGTGVAWIDADGDGDLDVQVLRTQGEPDIRYDNQAGALVGGTLPPLDDAGNNQGMDWGDYDNDGDADLYLVKTNGANRLFRNDGGGTFVDVTSPPLDHGLGDQGATWTDYDRDGRLDLYLTTLTGPNRLFRNQGAGIFVDATPPALAITGQCPASAWGDVDGDGDSDVYVSVADGPNHLVRNDGGGAFVDVTTPPLDDAGTAQGVSWADYDNDGDLDLYLSNFGQANRLFRNDGASGFVDVATGPTADAGQGQSGTWADYDNDRDLDLALTTFGQGSRILKNLGGGSFAVVAVLGDSTHNIGAAWGDCEADGDQDLFLAGYGSVDRLYRNPGFGGHWLDVLLQGTVSNRSGIGARITAFDLGSGLTQIREHGSNHGFWSVNAPAEHFGLGPLPKVDILVVRWPSGLQQVFHDVAVDRRITIVENGGVVGIEPIAQVPLPLIRAFPNPFRDTVQFSIGAPGRSELTIYDVRGRQVQSYTEGAPGPVSWDGRARSGEQVGTGVYFYRLRAEDGQSKTGRILRVR